MPKGPIVTPKAEALIASVYQKHPKWKAPRIRNEVESILRKEDRSLPKGWPSLSKVQKLLATIRKNLDKHSPEDEPWSIFTLDDYPVPPELLPRILEEYRHRKSFLEMPDDSGPVGELDFSIRQAKWFVRLSAVKPPELMPGFYIMVAAVERSFELVDRQPRVGFFEDLLAASTAGDREKETMFLIRWADYLLAEPESNQIEGPLGEKPRKSKKGKQK